MSRSLRIEKALLSYGLRAMAAGTAATTATLHYISCRPTDVDDGSSSNDSSPSPAPATAAAAAVPRGSSVAVVGGGIVGLLQARALAKEGYTVTLFEQAASVVPEEPAANTVWVPHPAPVLLTTPGGGGGGGGGSSGTTDDPTPLLRHGDLPHASALPWFLGGRRAAAAGYPAFSWGGLLSQPRRRGELAMVHNTACLVGSGGHALPHQRRGLGGSLRCVARMRAEAPHALAALLAELPGAVASPPLRRTAVVRHGGPSSPGGGEGGGGGGGPWLAPQEAEAGVDGFLASWSFAAARVLAGGGPAAGDAAAAYAVPRVPLVRALRASAVAGGVRLCEGTEVVGVVEAAAAAQEEVGAARCQLRLAGGRVADADAVVLCCGAEARRLNKGRLHLPVVNVQRRTVTEPASAFDDLPKPGSVLWDVDTAVSLMHGVDGLVTVSGMYEVCDRDRVPSDVVQKAFRDYLRHTVDPKDGSVCLPVLENLAVTPDYAPLVGSANGGGGAVFVNTGHGEHGLAGALATAGELAAAMKDPSLFGSSEILQRLLPGRFSLLW